MRTIAEWTFVLLEINIGLITASIIEEIAPKITTPIAGSNFP